MSKSLSRPELDAFARHVLGPTACYLEHGNFGIVGVGNENVFNTPVNYLGHAPGPGRRAVGKFLVGKFFEARAATPKEKRSAIPGWIWAILAFFGIKVEEK